MPNLSNMTNNKTEFSAAADMLIALGTLSLAAVYYYGMRAALVLIITVLTCCVTDFICIKLRKKERAKGDLSAVVTGLSLGLMMSASVTYYAAVTAAVFAIAIAKQAFGGRGCEIFNPAAAGFLFSSLCFPETMLTYPRAFAEIPTSSLVPESLLSQSLTKTFLTTEASSVTVLDALVGKFYSPMGAGFVIILAVAALFLILRRSVSGIMFFSQALVLGIIAFFRYDRSPISLLYFFSSGMLLFSMTFLSAENIPKTKSSRLICGVVLGLVTALFHFAGHAENAAVYAVIISAPISIELNRRSVSFAEMIKNKSIFGRTNKSLKHVAETIEMLENKEQGDKK
ncbi:MAG: RnfABCDGE type electron transport complex subunit D [Muribaculaceae bacterium]|nr:RnfABCDGE type electron transport complex subunit D [Muribaculaceae bacterium]MCM1478896.1 RnfABCDGE type electron transport complex subunit D [Muribaculaceae bacterium]